MEKGDLIKFSYKADADKKGTNVGIITKINEYHRADSYTGWKQVNKINFLSRHDYMEVFLVSERKKAIISMRIVRDIEVITQ